MVFEVAEVPATGVDLETGAKNPAQIIEIPRSQDEVILVGDYTDLVGGGKVAFDVSRLNAARSSSLLRPGCLRWK